MILGSIILVVGVHFVLKLGMSSPSKKQDPKVTYATIRVPENYNLPKQGGISLNYAVLKAKNETTSYPIIYLTGGPGSSGVSERRINAFSNSPFNLDRDIILLDQRGTGKSSPLPNFDKELYEIFAGDLNLVQELSEMETLLDSIHEVINASGRLISNYNTRNNAEDVNRLMEHLKYEKYNLWGVSYGTRLGRVIQDAYPEKINKVIFQGPSTVEGDFLVDRINNFSNSLRGVFTAIDTLDEQVSSTFDQYEQAIRDLKTTPWTITRGDEDFVINAQDAIYFVRRLLYRNNAVETIPILLSSISERDSVKFNNIINVKFSFIGINWSMLLSLESYEQQEYPLEDPTFDPYGSNKKVFPVGFGFLESFFRAGIKWNKPMLSAEKGFGNSSVPTLITVNSLDPVTPPSNAWRFMENLHNASVVVLNECGHVHLMDRTCQDRLFLDFLDHGTLGSFRDCLNVHTVRSML